MEQEKKIQEGPPIYIETVLSSKGWKENLKLYPNTCVLREPRALSEFKTGEFKWRWKMGDKLSEEEIKYINKGLDELKKLLCMKN